MKIRQILPLIVLTALAFAVKVSAQSKIVIDFTPACDSLTTLLNERTGVEGKLVLKSALRRGSSLNFYFTSSLGEYPWRKSDPKWFKSTFRSLFPPGYSSYRIGNIYSRSEPLENLVNQDPGSDGKPSPTRNKTKAPLISINPLVEKASSPYFSKGLEDRNIAMWASHGIYYDQVQKQWQWQRPCLFQTVEDLLSSTYVLQYLAPMLENAGAYVMMPRERDPNPVELVIDNDPSYKCSDKTTYRGRGKYSESGTWKSTAKGFADRKEIYSGIDNPFTMGTARTAACTKSAKANVATATWTPDFPARNEYAVYVSYNSFSNSSPAARYTVHHLGGQTEFYVNQKLGGGTWIYLGTFEFDKGGKVTLDNICPPDRRVESGSIVCADAVKFGGGMGNIARSGADGEEASVSGLPRYAEAARYWLQWAGMGPEIFNQNPTDDYKDDLYSRGEWVNNISGGSRTNPRKFGLRIPVDLAIALHTDAGITPDSTVIGTLVIYSASNENTRTLPTGEPMSTSREYADIVQSQIVRDLRHDVNPQWTRRLLSERGFRESRMTPAPTVLLECHSHQNFNDMKFALDPEFRFTLCRAVYKGMLKYLSNRYGCPYAVQPLPVRSFGIRFMNNSSIELSWEDTTDPLESTATPKGYILYTRVGDKGFDDGKIISNVRTSGNRRYTTLNIRPGTIYSYRIAAYNDGGKSFPSETLCAGIPLSKDGSTTASIDSTVLIVNNFTRLSPPVWFDGERNGSFDNIIDRGVQHIRDIAFTGEMYDRDKTHSWKSTDNPGFGASHNDMSGNIIAGNTFDYPYIHGTAIFKAGYPICSASSRAFVSDPYMTEGVWTADIICGKQVTTLYGNTDMQKHSVFPESLQEAIENFTAGGKHLLVSGEYIGTDIWDGIFPYEKDTLFTETSIMFAKEVLGFKWRTNFASRGGIVKGVSTKAFGMPGTMHFNTHNTSGIYPVETPDSIEPASENGKVILRYPDTGRPAGVCFTSPYKYKVVSLGIPLEAVSSQNERESFIKATLNFFAGTDK